MTYFKVIANGAAVDAGCMWLQWNARHQCLMACEPNAAHWAQSYDGHTVYRFGWLNPVPDGAPVYPTVEAAIIDAQEYDDLITVLDGGETVPEPVEPEPEPEPAPEPEPEPEDRPMSVQQMREKIAELTSMTAKDNYPQGSYFVLHDEIYQAAYPIVKGSEIRPGYNCEKKTLDEFLNQEGE